VAIVDIIQIDPALNV